MPSLRRIASFLDAYLGVRNYPDDRNGLLAGGDIPVRRLGLALEPTPDLRSWITNQRLDAVLLHRAWNLPVSDLPSGVGLLMYHLPFDDRLTPGYSPPLADTLGLHALEPLGRKRGRPVGMIGRCDATDFDVLQVRVSRAFEGLEEVVVPRRAAVQRIAVVGAMTDTLVREAAARGAHVYLTGQLRVPARQAVAQTGIGVLTTGHRRAEEWGLRMLGTVLRQRWPMLELRVGIGSAGEQRPG